MTVEIPKAKMVQHPEGETEEYQQQVEDAMAHVVRFAITECGIEITAINFNIIDKDKLIKKAHEGEGHAHTH